MESRALGAYSQRTFLKTTAITGKDTVFLSVSLTLLVLVTAALIHFGLFHLNAGFQL
jgi:energy-coupling factor transporter transmembrane protein EcfT